MPGAPFEIRGIATRVFVCIRDVCSRDGSYAADRNNCPVNPASTKVIHSLSVVAGKGDVRIWDVMSKNLKGSKSEI